LRALARVLLTAAAIPEKPSKISAHRHLQGAPDDPSTRPASLSQRSRLRIASADALIDNGFSNSSGFMPTRAAISHVQQSMSVVATMRVQLKRGSPAVAFATQTLARSATNVREVCTNSKERGK
jgi:hypothetical protein